MINVCRRWAWGDSKNDMLHPSFGDPRKTEHIAGVWVPPGARRPPQSRPRLRPWRRLAASGLSCCGTITMGAKASLTPAMEMTSKETSVNNNRRTTTLPTPTCSPKHLEMYSESSCSVLCLKAPHVARCMGARNLPCGFTKGSRCNCKCSPAYVVALSLSTLRDHAREGLRRSVGATLAGQQREPQEQRPLDLVLAVGEDLRCQNLREQRECCKALLNDTLPAASGFRNTPAAPEIK